MKAVELTKNEREVLVAIVANAKHYGEDNNFVSIEVAFKLGKTPRSVAATTGSLQKKGMVHMHQGEGGYFDGELTEAGLHEVESSKVNKEQEVKQSNNSKNMATKKAKTVKVEDSKSVNNAVENFDAPVMDERIVKLNELKAVKMAAISSKKRPAAKEAKELATFVLENWDNIQQLEFMLSNAPEETKFDEGKNVLDIAQDRRNQLTTPEKAPKAKTEKKETKKAEPAKAEKAPTKKEAKKADKEEQPKEKEAKTARKVGDVHPNHPTWIWTEYAEGKFDWRTNPADKKQGQRTDKSKASEKKSEPKKDTKKATNKKVAKVGKVETKKEEKPKELTIDEFVALPSKTAKTNKKPREAQKEALKLIMKGYRVTADHKFFESAEGDRKSCNWDSVTALFKRYGMDYVPAGLVK